MYRKNIYLDIDAVKKKSIESFCTGYKHFLSAAKTERLAVAEIEKIAISNGFKPFRDISELQLGDKIYFINRNKNIILYRLGSKDLTEGLNILGAHIDSPRLDLKQNPLIESNGFSLLDTRYYGNIKNYQYVAIPLAIHGVVYKKDGTSVNISIGEKEADPIIGITDLAVHLASEQLQKSGDKIIDGEDLDVIVGSVPCANTSENAVRANLVRLLEAEYNLSDNDFLSAELEIVPAGSAKDFGLDRSMIAGYGQDDRACAYTILRAIMDADITEGNACAIFVDKEEIGNFCSTGAESVFFENTLLELLHKYKEDDLYSLRKTLEKSHMLVCDAVPAADPVNSSVSDPNNSAQLNHGVVIEKYLGSSGKFGSNDANPEFLAKLRHLMDSNHIHYQLGEIGKVDQGSGGTFSYIAAKYNMEVADSGVPLLNMHSPMEIAAKADVYEAYLFYKEFMKYGFK